MDEWRRVRDLSGRDLEELLDRAARERWTALAIVGPNIRLPTIERWPDSWRSFGPIYRQHAPAPELAKNVSALTTLTSLRLVGLGLGAPAASYLSRLTALTSLDLTGNQLTDAGASHIAKLTTLTALHLGNNRLTNAGTPHIAKLSALAILHLGNNQLSDAGASSLSQLSALTALHLQDNQLTDAGAAHIATLPALATLDLGGNQLTDEGAHHVAKLCSVTVLDLRNNKLTDAGVSHIAKLSALTALDLRNNRLTDAGAPHIAKLSTLTSLYLGGNQLTDAGFAHIAKLSRLAALDLDGNRITDNGVSFIAKLPALTALYLGGNRLSDVSAAYIAELPALTTLYLSSNRLGDRGAAHVARLRTLITLHVSSNHITDVGAAHISKLSALTALYIGNNKLTDRGAQHLGVLTGLTALDLSGTDITDLSPFVPLMERGLAVSRSLLYGVSCLSIQHCPLVRPPLEVVNRGGEAILRYFREIETQGIAYLFEAKVMIVGEGGAGKTSLRRRLYQPSEPLPSEDESTRGIDILVTGFSRSDGTPFRLNVWDFGGQQIYHATHQFFLTKSAIYVLVDDTRRNDTSVHDPGFKYWLEVVEALSDHSPVLIFQNEKGGRSKTIDQAGIKGRFPSVRHVYQGDLLLSDAAGGLRRAIEGIVQELPHVGEVLPALWLAIREALERRGREVPYVSLDEYFDVYRQYLPFDRDRALTLSRYLHDLGAFLHFQDDPRLRHLVILRNDWATGAVFAVVNDERIRARAGRFTPADCDRLWADADHTDKQHELLSLMERFELCYRLADRVEWIAPQLLLPSAPGDLDRSPRPGDLIVQFRYEFMPAGLVNRLMVRQHRFVPRPEWGWKSGCLFEREGTSVLVVTAANGREIHLTARGPERKALLSVIANDLDALNERFDGLKVEKWVPCCCLKCASSAGPFLFSESALRRRREKGKLDVECEASFETVSVLMLLDGLDTSQTPAWAAKGVDHARSRAGASVLPRAIKIFLASSSELREDRDAFDLHFRQQNDDLRKEGIYLEITRWENFLDAMSPTRSQDEYNRAVRATDIFVALFGTKAGPYTREELSVAIDAFHASGRRKPAIYTYFKEAAVTLGHEDRAGMTSLWELRDDLKRRELFPTLYKNTEELKLHFAGQLRKLQDADRL